MMGRNGSKERNERMTQEPTKKRADTIKDVYEKLRRAYSRNTGCRLTADDVFQLVKMDSAIGSVTHPETMG